MECFCFSSHYWFAFLFVCFSCFFLLSIVHIRPYIDIIRYLGGRFPETTSAVDENGRTALHYAAAIKDNGHFYNLLVHLGANPKAIDNVLYLSFSDFLLRIFK